MIITEMVRCKKEGTLINKFRILFDWKDLLIVLSFLTAFLFFCIVFYDFILDDAFITFRYSENLANGHGPVWNPGEDPVEGYTSFIWMALMALLIKMGKDPVAWAKLISIGAGAFVIAVIYLYSRLKTESRAISALAASCLALSPAFAFNTIQGMETTFAALLVMCTVLFCMRMEEASSHFVRITFCLFLLLACLTRPDLTVFGSVLLIGMIRKLAGKNRKKELHSFLITAILLLLAPGLAYMVWRINYYGYYFPNAFYVKQSGTAGVIPFLSLRGTEMSFHYLIEILSPYIILVLYSLTKENTKWGKRFFKESAFLLGSLLCFLALHCCINPIQGFLYRYQMPTLPALLLLFAFYMRGIHYSPSKTKGKQSERTKRSSNETNAFFGLALFAFVLVFPLHTMDDVMYERRSRAPHDRVAIGKELRKLAENNYTMFVTESGALPYYSKWRSIDYLGLNSEAIARKGLTMEHLEEIKPHLIMVIISSVMNINERYPTICEFIEKNDYIPIAAIKKSEIRSTAHVYYVMPGESASIIADRVKNIPNLEYLDIRIWM